MVFTTGCNFSCPYCHNPDLASGSVTGSKGLDAEEIFSFLASRKNLVDGVVITGGEPCLQPDLTDFILRIRHMGLAVKLDTNGSRPEVLAHLLDRSLVDYVAMDIKTAPSLYPEIMKDHPNVDAIQESIDLIMARVPAYEFRTTCVRPFIDTSIMKQIIRQIRGARRYVLQKCIRHVSMLDPHFSQHPDRFFSNQDIQALKTVIKGAVQEIIVR